jgi:hypothetical protein
LPGGQARWDGRARWLLEQTPPKAAPPSQRVRPYALIALDRGHGIRSAGGGVPCGLGGKKGQEPAQGMMRLRGNRLEL